MHSTLIAKPLVTLLAVLTAPLAAHAKLNVVATTPEFAAIARAIGGALVEVDALARPTEDPHFVDAKPSFIVKLNRADVLIEGGAELEAGWLAPLLESARNLKLARGAVGHIVAYKGIELLEVPASLDRAHGHVHAMGNPHFMTDPLNAQIVAERIGEAFCALDAVGCEHYQANLAEFSARLNTKLAQWQRQLTPFVGARIVAYHNTWPYFAQRFGLRIDLFLEPRHGIPPTPSSLAEVIATMKVEKIRVIIVEPYQNRKTAETAAKQTGAMVLDFAQYPGGVKGTEGGYIELMDHLVRSLAAALGGEASR